MNIAARTFRLAAAFALACALAAASPAAALAAGNVKTIAGPRGGEIVFARTPVTDPIGALHGSGRAFSTYFRGPLAIESFAESTDGRAAYATFHTTRGASLVGVLLAAKSTNGTQLVAIVDRPGRFRQSFGPMLAALQGGGNAASGAPATAGLRPYEFPDHSGSVSLPADWTVKSAGQGQVIAQGPQGQTATLGVGLLVVDPRAGLQAQVAQRSGGLVLPYAADPAKMYREVVGEFAQRQGAEANVTIASQRAVPGRGPTALLAGEENAKGGRESFLGVFEVGPMQMGGYTCLVQIVATPSKRLKADMPTLVAIYKSYRVNGAVRAQQVETSERQAQAFSNATIANIHATGAASMAAARASQDAMDRSTSGFVHYLNGSDVIESVGSGARGSTDAGFAQSLVRDDPQNFRIVPMSQYRAGD